MRLTRRQKRERKGERERAGEGETLREGPKKRMKQGEKTVMTRMEKRAMKRASKGCGRETIGRMIEKKRKPEEVGEKREAETIARAKDRERYFRQLPFENDSI